jgi:hypothetical protein
VRRLTNEVVLLKHPRPASGTTPPAPLTRGELNIKNLVLKNDSPFFFSREGGRGEEFFKG